MIVWNGPSSRAPRVANRVSRPVAFEQIGVTPVSAVDARPEVLVPVRVDASASVVEESP